MATAVMTQQQRDAIRRSAALVRGLGDDIAARRFEKQLREAPAAPSPSAPLIAATAAGTAGTGAGGSGVTLDASELTALIERVDSCEMAARQANDTAAVTSRQMRTVSESAMRASSDVAALKADLIAATEAMRQARPIVVTDATGKPLGTPVSGARAELEDVLTWIAAGITNLWWYGPKGCGKTTLAAMLAKALGVELVVISCKEEMTASSIEGMLTADGTYRETAFTAAFDKPCVILFDEADVAAPGTLVGCLNAPLANGILSIPKHHNPERRCIRRHARCIVVLTANTAGFGPSAEYCSRNAQDTALLDRCCGGELFMDYDTALEGRMLAGREDLLSRLWRIRGECVGHKLKRWIGTRAVEAASRFAAAGWADDRIIRRIIGGWTATERAKLSDPAARAA